MSLADADRQTLLQVARSSIQYTLENGRDAHYENTLKLGSYSSDLQQQRATFVTLNINSELRGCIGTLEAHQALVIDVAHNARAAAFHDPRFSPLSQKEFEQLDIHISVLGVPELMTFSSEQELTDLFKTSFNILKLQTIEISDSPAITPRRPTRSEMWPTGHWNTRLPIRKQAMNSEMDFKSTRTWDA